MSYEQLNFPFYKDVLVNETSRDFKHYMGLQMREIEEHKYFLSEKAGHDIGNEYACQDWVNSGHAERFHDNYVRRGAKNIDDVLFAIETYKSIAELAMDDIHRILGD